MTTAYCFDLDGTITTTEILPCIASELGVADEIATLTQLTIDGLVPFADSLRLRSLILGQVPLERVRQIVRNIPLESRLVSFIKDRSEQCIIITGNLDVWVEPLAELLPCEWVCSPSSEDDGRVWLKRALNKGDFIRSLKSTHEFTRYVAIGDGANDESMLAEADEGIAYGAVHSPVSGAVAASRFVVNSPETLCNLLKAL